MPTDYIKSVAKEKKLPIKEVERIWEKAKKQAEENNHKDEYDYITGIFKNMIANKTKKEKKDE